MSAKVRWGKIAVPEDWELRLQITYIEPATEPGSLPIANPLMPPPRANLLVSRQLRSPSVTNANEARESFLKEAAQSIPRLHVRKRGFVIFDDGQEGAIVEIDFPVTEQIRLVQGHLFRVDYEVITQIVTTVDPNRHTEASDELTRMALTFCPE